MFSQREQFSVLANPKTRVVFDHLARRRSARIQELLADVKDTAISASDVEKELERLRDAGLVAEKRSSLQALNRYYVTANGLQAERQL